MEDVVVVVVVVVWRVGVGGGTHASGTHAGVAVSCRVEEERRRTKTP